MKDYTVYAMPDCGATKGLSIENGIVKGYLGISTNIVIPSYYKGDTVVSIGNSAINGERDTAEMPQNLQNKYENSLLMIA